MQKIPSYVQSLNNLANAELGGQQLFEKWAEKTSNVKLRDVLRFVAVREAEHSWAFRKRLEELGFCMETRTNPAVKKLKRLMASRATDEEKFQAFGIGVKSKSPDGPDGLLRLLADTSIDPQTGSLLGRFICEERDSGRRLVKAYRALKREQNRKKK